ncbi:phosphate acyltransferase [Mycoplasma corogypsi]|uniref:phosphate acyltransferase n=1 Tax=Mycoplasma corogypsi TaxID=2106 RepID=UPI003872B762
MNNFLSLIEKPTRVLVIDCDDSRMLEASIFFKNHKNILLTLLCDDENHTHENRLFISEKEKQALKQDFLLRKKKKETLEQVDALFKDKLYSAAMLVEQNKFDVLVAGLVHNTASVLRCALKCIGVKNGVKRISGNAILTKNKEQLIFADVAVNTKVNQATLLEIAQNAAYFAKSLNIEPKVAFLSYSTNLSAPTKEALAINKVAKRFAKKHNDIKSIGEIQFDAAIDLATQKQKFKVENPEKYNVMVFPNLDSSNISYKVAERLGNYKMSGPFISGLNKVVNDLSRGSSVEGIIETIVISALQAQK